MTIFRWYPLPEAIDWATRGREAALSAGTVSLVFLMKFFNFKFYSDLENCHSSVSVYPFCSRRPGSTHAWACPECRQLSEDAAPYLYHGSSQDPEGALRA